MGVSLFFTSFRWCKKVAFFRVFEKDYTLCLYVRYFADDPVLAFSNTDIGVTVYNYWGKKSFYKLGMYHIKLP